MDWVELGSYITVAVAFIIPAWLAYKGYKLIWKNDGK